MKELRAEINLYLGLLAQARTEADKVRAQERLDALFRAYHAMGAK